MPKPKEFFSRAYKYECALSKLLKSKGYSINQARKFFTSDQSKHTKPVTYLTFHKWMRDPPKYFTLQSIVDIADRLQLEPAYIIGLMLKDNIKEAKAWYEENSAYFK